jgi:hypothetical protein
VYTQFLFAIIAVAHVMKQGFASFKKKIFFGTRKCMTMKGTMEKVDSQTGVEHGLKKLHHHNIFIAQFFCC